jgi:hypothetical protein
MAEIEFESDEFLKLLTDALRAGPGSPAWHQALDRLRTQGVADADELRLLCEVRQHLESGKDYRMVRAGPGFSRKLMAAVEEQSARSPRGLPPATLLAIVGAMLIVGVMVGVGIILLRSSTTQGPELLKNALLASEVFSSDFSDGTPGWRPIEGRLLVKASNGLTVQVPRDLDGGTYHGGGILADKPLAARDMFEALATVGVGRPTEQLAVQLFVTDEPSFPQSPQSANPRHELVCMIQGSQVRVGLPDGSVKAGRSVQPGQTLRLRIRMDRQFVLVDNDDQQVYLGRHGLSEDRPRYVGVRFEARGYERPDALVVRSVKILKP